MAVMKTRPSKVLMLLVDALREDFVEMGPDQKQYLEGVTDPYEGTKISCFHELSVMEPMNTIFLPLVSEMPTVTAVRVKSLLTGALNSYFEIKDNFDSGLVQEDNLLYQMNHRTTKEPEYIVFSGDYTWIGMYGTSFNRSYPFESFNVQELDPLDIYTHDIMLQELKGGNFTLFISHIIGVDHAGHSFGPKHPELERKVKDSDKILRDVIDALDNDTVLIAFGDHGMTEGGTHGGATPKEMRTVMFAYTKSGFPMKERLVNDTELLTPINE